MPNAQAASATSRAPIWGGWIVADLAYLTAAALTIAWRERSGIGIVSSSIQLTEKDHHHG